MRIARDGNGAVDQSADEGPDEAGNGLRPTAHHLQTERQTVDIGAIIGNDAQGQDDEAKLAKTAERRNQHCSQQTANVGAFVAIGIDVRRVGHGGGCHRQTEHFGEAERENEATKGPGKDSDPIGAARLVYGVVSRITRPAGPEAKDAGREGKDRPSLGAARVHGEIREFAGVSEFAQNDEEDDETRDPGPVFVEMHDLIAEKRDDEGRGGNDYDPCISWHVGIDRVEELRADYHVDRRPPYAGQDVEEGD